MISIKLYDSAESTHFENLRVIFSYKIKIIQIEERNISDKMKIFSPTQLRLRIRKKWQKF